MSSVKHSLFAFALVVTPIQHSLATSVLVIEMKADIVYLAADGLQRQSLSGQTSPFCKIKKLGNVYWAAASNSYLNPNTGFDVEKIVASIGATGTIESMMQRFIKAVNEPLEREVAAIERNEPTEYAHYIAGTHDPLEIVFVGMEKGRPTWAVTRFFVKLDKDHIVIAPLREPRVRPGTGLGLWGPAGDYVIDHLADFALDPTKTINQGLQRAADADPTGVGRPFSVLRFTSSGPRWLERGECKKPVVLQDKIKRSAATDATVSPGMPSSPALAASLVACP